MACASLIIAGHIVLPYLPLVSPHPVVTGYIGYYAGMLALLLIPMIVLARSGFRIIWGHRLDPRTTKMLIGTWVVSFVVFFATLVFGVRNFAYSAKDLQHLSHEIRDKSLPLRLHIDDIHDNYMDDRINVHLGSCQISQGKLYVDLDSDIRILPNDADVVKINIHTQSQGSSPRQAKLNCQLMSPAVAMDSDALTISNYYWLERTGRFRGQSRQVEVLIPLGQIVHLSGNKYSLYSGDFVDQSSLQADLWKMSDKGLVPLEQKSL